MDSNSSAGPDVPFRLHRRPAVLAGSVCIAVAIAAIGLGARQAGAASPLAVGPQAAQQGPPPPDDTLAQADAALKSLKYDEAIKLYKRASSALNDRSPDALWGLARAYSALGAAKNVGATLDKYLPLVADDPVKEAEAHNLRGLSVWDAAQRSSDARKFAEAERHFTRATEVWPDLALAHYNLGLALLKRKADPEGIAQLTRYLEQAPSGSYAASARRFIENPRRTREDYATEFSATSADGERVSLADLTGKVVVLDFWATWCEPCKTALPSFRRLASRSVEEPLVLISISGDADARAWRKFIAENQMTWPQLHDLRKTLHRAYAVEGIPTYVVIDHEGIVRDRVVGYSAISDANLQTTIRKWVKAAKAAAAK